MGGIRVYLYENFSTKKVKISTSKPFHYISCYRMTSVTLVNLKVCVMRDWLIERNGTVLSHGYGCSWIQVRIWVTHLKHYPGLDFQTLIIEVVERQEVVGFLCKVKEAFDTSCNWVTKFTATMMMLPCLWWLTQNQNQEQDIILMRCWV